MDILFLTRHFGCLRNFERPIFRLARAGHRVHLAAHQDDVLGGLAMVERWVGGQSGITFERVPGLPPSPFDDLATRLRLAVDYLRYVEPAYSRAFGLVQRAHKRTPRWILSATQAWWGRTWVARRAMRALLLALERVVPRNPGVDAFITARSPDLVLITPLLALGSAEMDYLDAARALGRPTIFCVWSWDNLSSKARLRTLPEAVMVWNETQKREAVTLHAVPARRVVVTGAQSFDQWFEWTARRSQAEFRRHVGLPGDRPFLLWVCSALLHGSAPEAPFVRQWLARLRASDDPALREVGVLIRPHPARLQEWADMDLDGLGPVSVWGTNPTDDAARADYFESLAYAAAVAGLNTSAFLEAAIVGRPVHTVLLPEHFDNQEGTLHFEYLMNVGGGLLHVARSWDKHLDDLRHALTRPEGAPDERSQRFVEAFIRPYGRAVNATDRFVEAVEHVAAEPAGAPLTAPFWAPMGRAALGGLRELMKRQCFMDWWRSPREYEKKVAIRRKRAAKDRARELAQLAQVRESRAGGSRPKA